jgi:hypothetical protein
MADAFPKSPGRLVSPSGIPHLIEADVTPIAFFQSILIPAYLSKVSKIMTKLL